MRQITAIRSNPPTPAQMAQQASAVPPNAMPVTIYELVQRLMPVVAAFRNSSVRQSVPLPLEQPAIGVTGNGVRIAQVGLGERIVSWHHVVIQIINTAGAAQTVQLSQWFPYDLITNTTVAINGGETPYSCSGRAGLAVFARDRSGFWAPQYSKAGLNPAVVAISAIGANLTFTAAAVGSVAPLAGNTQISVAANSVAGAASQFTVDFFTVEKLAMSRDTLLGALPLQNNQTFATITTQPNAALFTTANNQTTAPLFNAGANLTPSIITWNVQRTYFFWGIPADQSLYLPLIQNSYQVIEQKGISVNATGVGALVYGIPSNAYVKAFHMWVTDNNGNPVNASNYTKLYLTYNAGAVTPFFSFPERERFIQYADYDADLQPVPGYRLWDGDATAEYLDVTDDAGWLDTYSAAEPQLNIDLAAGAVTPVTFNITREQIVAGAVQQLGG